MAELNGKSKEELEELMDDEHNKRWYAVVTYVGHENRVKENLEKRIETMNIQDALFRVVVAEESETTITKTGKKQETKKNLFPGYIFVEMKMTDEAWYVVRNTPGVTGFIGSSGKGAKPFPIADDEMDAILRRLGKADPHVAVPFKVGDSVKVTTGPFIGMVGTVSSMDDNTCIANVMLNLFGRETPTDVAYTDLEPADGE